MDGVLSGFANGREFQAALRLNGDWGIGLAMRHYRATIFKYAILINVALASFVILLSLKGISDYFGMLERWTAHVPADEINGVFEFDGPVQPSLDRLLFPVAMALDALVLMLSSIASLRRGSRRSHWLRIFSLLAILGVIWFEAVRIFAWLINEGMEYRILESPMIVRTALIALVTILLLVYNLRYRAAAPDAGTLSR